MFKHDTFDKKVPLNLYDQIIDDHNYIYQCSFEQKYRFSIFGGLNLIIILYFKEMKNILGYGKKNIHLVNY